MLRRIAGVLRCSEKKRGKAEVSQQQWIQLTAHLVLLHGLFQVIVDPGDDVATEARPGKQGGGRGRSAK